MYKILLIAPYPPIKGGMAILSKTLAKNFEDDSNIVFRLQLYSGLKGVILLPLIYLKMLVFSLKADIIHVISASGRSLIFKDLPAILIAKLFNKKSYIVNTYTIMFYFFLNIIDNFLIVNVVLEKYNHY